MHWWLFEDFLVSVILLIWFLCYFTNTRVPPAYSQAAKHVCCVKAIQEELQAFQENYTWDIVPCPTSVKLISCKWVYSIKLQYDGTLDKYEERLPALSNQHEYRVDFEETFVL